MAKVIGLGGVFFRSEDPAALRAWYGEGNTRGLGEIEREFELMY